MPVGAPARGQCARALNALCRLLQIQVGAQALCNERLEHGVVQHSPPVGLRMGAARQAMALSEGQGW